MYSAFRSLEALKRRMKSAFFSSMVITYIFRLPCPPLAKRESLTHSQALALSKRARDVTALRCSEPLRYKVGGASKPSPWFLRDGTAKLLWRSACNYIAESECMEGACRLSPPELFLIAVSLCTCRHSNEEYCFYTTFERITSGEVSIRGSIFQNGTNFFK